MLPRSRLLFGSILVVPTLAAAIIAGCGDDDVVTKSDAGGDTSAPDTYVPPVDSGTDAPADAGVDAAAQIARGKYLVDHVAACGDCHTPRTNTGAPDMAKYLSGVDCFLDVDPAADAGGCLSSANLTNDPTGLKNRTDAQIKKMFMDGVRPDGKFLASVMPYWVFHNMKNEDADAIVAYLRTVPAVSHTAQANQAPFDNIPAAATPIDPATIPAADAGGGASAANGRYLATMAGPCLECHTPELAQPAARPIDMTKPFAGGRGFPRQAFGLTNPPFPDVIYSSNITQHDPSGISAYTIQDIVKVIKQGKDRTDGGVCPPMPVGPMGAFGGLTDQDALDIATYIKSLPPIDNQVPNGCVVP